MSETTTPAAGSFALETPSRCTVTGCTNIAYAGYRLKGHRTVERMCMKCAADLLAVHFHATWSHPLDPMLAPLLDPINHPSPQEESDRGQ